MANSRQKKKYDLGVFYSGETMSEKNFVIKKNGVAINITNADIQFLFEKDGKNENGLTMTIANSRVTVVNGASGHFRLNEHDVIANKGDYTYKCWITIGDYKKVYMFGQLQIEI